MKKGLILLVILVTLITIYQLGGRTLKDVTSPVSNWPIPSIDSELGEPSGIAIDTADNVIVFHRAGREWPILQPMPKAFINSNTITIFDNKSGKALHSWGKNLFIMPHGFRIDNKGNYWLTDVGLHQVFKYRADGRLLLKLGEAGVPGADRVHFDKPTDIAVVADGSFYVSDGYGNSRIVKFSADGQYLLEWGRKGSANGEFSVPHSLVTDRAGRVYVADRENKRIQIFTGDGRFIRQITSKAFGKVTSLAIGANGDVYAADDANIFGLIHRGSAIFKIPARGEPIAVAAQSGWIHALATDSIGDLYTGDISGNLINKYLIRDRKGNAPD